MNSSLPDFRLMLDAYLKSLVSPARLALVAPPSRVSFNLIKSLWRANHVIFPIVPDRSPYLNHLITESRCQGLLTLIPGFDTTVRQLNVPLVKYTVEQHFPPQSSIGSVIVEGKYHGSSIPLAALIDRNAFEKHKDYNRKIIGPTETVLSLSKHWILDSVSFESESVFPDDAKPSPSTVIVDSESTTDLLQAIKDGKVGSASLDRLIVTVSDAISVNSLRDEIKKLPCAPRVDLRFFVPEFGPVAPLVPLNEFEGVHSICRNDEACSLKIEDESLLVSSPFRFSYYISRPRTTETCFRSDGFFVTHIRNEITPTLEGKKSLRKKRMIMQGDWRVRQVPIAVYHKKRGFKGQIYYTTKHKGWTLYRSRYYN